MNEAKNLTRFDRLTEDNIEAMAKKIVAGNLPVLSRLKIDYPPKPYGSREKPARNSDDVITKDLVNILRVQCLTYGFPLVYVLDGAWRADAKSEVSYFGKAATALWAHIAEERGLPRVKHVEYQYILDDIETSIAMQPMLKQLLRKQTSANSGWKSGLISKLKPDNTQDIGSVVVPAHVRFLHMEPDRIYKMNMYPGVDKKLFVVTAGDYNLAGIHGVIEFNDGSNYEYTYNINPDKTKTHNEGYNGKPSTPTAYSTNPLQFLETKFMRFALSNFYSSRATILDPLEKDPDDIASDLEEITEDEVSERIDGISETYAKNKAKACDAKASDHVKAKVDTVEQAKDIAQEIIDKRK